MAYAQSTPGVITNRNDTAQNAARTLMGIGLPNLFVI
jgi:hypothetical protein